MKKQLLFFIFYAFTPLLLNAQSISLGLDSIINRINRQFQSYPQEKIYIQTDKSYYMAGENIWFRIHIAEATSHQPIAVSKYAYIELITPSDSIVKRIKIKEEKGIYCGRIPLTENLAEGNYTVYAYTAYTDKNQEKEGAKKRIFINSAYASLVEINAQFSENSKKETIAKIQVYDKQKKTKIKSQQILYRIGKGKLKKGKLKKDSAVYITLAEKEKADYLYLEVNSYKKYIPVPEIPTEDFDVSFYPEGGYLIQGQNCRIAFKALNSQGKPERIQGEIMDQTGKKIAEFNSLHQRMGTFYLTPRKEYMYRAICTDSRGIKKTFQLPEPSDKATVIRTEWSKERLKVSLAKTKELSSGDSLVLVVLSRGNILYAQHWDTQKENITFDKKEFPSGIIQLLLIDKQGNTLSERMTFCLNKDQAVASVYNDQEQYPAREKAKIRVEIYDKEQKPLKGNFAVAITDDKQVKNDTTFNILSSLLLTSELKGYIERPSFYLQEGNPEAEAVREALMLTHGWKRYDIPEAIKGNYQYPQGYMEIGQEIAGKVNTFFREKPREGVQVSILSTNVMYANITQTDKEGNFRFNGFDFPDSTKYIVQAFTPKGGDRIELKMENEERTVLRKALPEYRQNTFQDKKILQEYVEKTNQKLQYSDGIRSVLLDEVIITARKIKTPETIYETLAAKSFTAEEIEESKASNIEELLIRLPGVRISNGRVILSGVPATFGIDGILIEPLQEDKAERNLPPGKLFINDGTNKSLQKNLRRPSTLDFNLSNFDYNAIPVQDIERIDVIKSWNSAIFGFRGSNGVIMITTKKGNFTPKKTQIPLNVARIMPLGFQKPAEFYSPKYETFQQKDNPVPDLRTTIYWNPHVETSPDGKAYFDFYTADSPSTYTLTIEGITENGKIIRKGHSIKRL